MQLPVASDDAVAGDEKRDGISAAGICHGPAGLRSPNLRGDLPVAFGFAARNPGQGEPYFFLKRRTRQFADGWNGERSSAEETADEFLNRITAAACDREPLAWFDIQIGQGASDYSSILQLHGNVSPAGGDSLLVAVLIHGGSLLSGRGNHQCLPDAKIFRSGKGILVRLEDDVPFC